MLNKEILKIYEDEKALLKGHFILSSEKHSSVYLQSAIVLSIPKYLNIIAKNMISLIKKNISFREIELIVSPAMGGIVIGNKIGELLKKQSIFLERVKGNFTLRRGFEIKEKQKILLVEDVITTGKSSLECVNCVENYGGEVIGLSSIIDRSNIDLNFSFPYTSCLKIDAPIYDKSNIPLKLKKIPPTKPGSRFIK